MEQNPGEVSGFGYVLFFGVAKFGYIFYSFVNYIILQIQDDYTVICRGLLKKESNIELFQNLKVELSTGEQGKIEGNFGQSGKIKIRISDGIGEKCKNALGGKGSKKERNKKNQSAKEEGKQPTTVTNETVLLHLKFKRYIFDLGKKMIQT
uniref:selenocysteine-specific elongation factor-like n=1 Tax=Styela clava TaxID=7725 RepID=UPI001939A131|nr:selenocysteine-specific elongation factor-like [Styela clava]